MSGRRFRLGAEELIELGNGRVGVDLDRRPFLAGRQRHQMGSSYFLGIADPIADLEMAAPYVADRLGKGLGALSDVVGIPLGALAQSADVAADKLAGVVAKVPALGDLVSQVLVLGGSLVKAGLTAPGMTLRGLGNVLEGAARKMKEGLGESGLQEKIEAAVAKVVNEGPAAVKGAVKAVLEASGVSGKSPALPATTLVEVTA